MVLAQRLGIAMLGVAAGFALGLGATRVMGSLRCGVSPRICSPSSRFRYYNSSRARRELDSRPSALSIDPTVALRQD
jgi:hypothetical protein